MVSPDDVATSKAIQQRTGPTFHLATRLLPERVRRPTYVLYGFFRVADDVVDDTDRDAERQRRELEEIRAAVLEGAETDDPVLEAYRELADTYDIPGEETETFLDVMAMDLETRRYETHDDLEAYLRGSAVSVGYMMLDVMAAGDEMSEADVAAARPHAKALGEAFQLTNFLRDVREDVRDYDRIYLPTERLDAHGVTVEEIEDCSFSERYAALMRAELRRTERLYREGIAGIEFLPEDCQFAVLLAAVLYADHHRVIREHGYDTLSERHTLSTPRRLFLVAATGYHWLRTHDPVETFYAVSDVPRVDGSEAERGSRRSARSVRTRARAAVSTLRGVWE
ncbi:phytoene/squalene synthase family protein (plasmid) [Halarchaeum sp. CBA1220]|uniref:phytoene/squalene synthase family protein n=1 Tax=Halarchaeum sp. CBA1220 TaxID=1853682 RepID=UPI0015A0BE8B|nr:phytoene/squalene synthase family protein [Halarchaeum sp. CBA1220]QLC35032.1 phytoene/squalene synthase family protein [Halarchaeum sp. CBA1220]